MEIAEAYLLSIISAIEKSDEPLELSVDAMECSVSFLINTQFNQWNF
jgi:hypothetical protein